MWFYIYSATLNFKMPPIIKLLTIMKYGLYYAQTKIHIHHSEKSNSASEKCQVERNITTW